MIWGSDRKFLDQESLFTCHGDVMEKSFYFFQNRSILVYRFATDCMDLDRCGPDETERSNLRQWRPPGLLQGQCQ